MGGCLRWDWGVGRGEVVGGEVGGVGEEGEGAAVEGEGDLDFGFVGAAVYEGGAEGEGHGLGLGVRVGEIYGYVGTGSQRFVVLDHKSLKEGYIRFV